MNKNKSTKNQKGAYRMYKNNQKIPLWMINHSQDNIHQEFLFKLKLKIYETTYNKIIL